jgi:hypothetical protein
MRRITLGLALACVALASCGKSEAKKREEIDSCGTNSLDAAGISLCLVAEFRWDSGEAKVAGLARERQLDSLAAWRRDSAWHAGAKQHRDELARCAASGGDVARCLENTYNWDEPHAVATFDSVWRHEAPKHRDQIKGCQRQRKSNLGSCLMLYYKWDPKHALALADSLERAKIKALRSR